MAIYSRDRKVFGEIAHIYPYSHLITPSNATNAIAFAGKALKKHGKNPRQYPFIPLSLLMATAASFHVRNFLSPSPSAPPNGSVIIRCFTTSDGYDVNQKTCAERPPAQKLIAGVDISVYFLNPRVMRS